MYQPVLCPLSKYPPKWKSIQLKNKGASVWKRLISSGSLCNIQGRQHDFQSGGGAKTQPILRCYNFWQFLTVFHLWSLKAYTKSCFYKLTARSCWFKSPLLAVDHGWTAKENFEFHPFTNAPNGLHETFWYIFS